MRFFVEEFGVVLTEFVEEDVVLAADVSAVGGDEEEEDGVALDVAQETYAEPFAPAGAFDDAGDVRHDEGAVVAVGDDAEVGDEGGEGVVGDFGFGGGDDGEEGGFSGVGESDEPDIGEDFEFEDDGALDAGFAGLGEAGGLVGGGFEVPVAEPSASSFDEEGSFAVGGDFADGLSGFGVAATVPRGTSTMTSSPSAPVLRFSLPLPPSPAKMWRWYLRWMRVQ